MFKRVTAVTVIIVFVASCAIVKQVPVDQIATVHLCYELITGSQSRGVAISEELNLRGESCEKYQEQISLMIEAEAKRSAALRAAIINMSNNFNANGPIDTYIASQKALQPQPVPVFQMPKMVNCNSYRMGNMTNTQCY